MQSDRTYLPAAGHDLFLPIYDPFTRIFGFDSARRRLIDQAALQTHHRVLDVGCGTGTLAIQIKRRHPTIDVVGVDPDPRALARAQRKAERAGVTVRFERGFAGALIYRDASFDRVFSSMMFHHLEDGDKENALGEIRRVLKPGGRLELLDFARAGTHGHGLLGRLVHSHHQLRDNSDRRILDLMAAARFVNPKRVGAQATLFGRIAFFTAGS